MIEKKKKEFQAKKYIYIIFYIYRLGALFFLHVDFSYLVFFHFSLTDSFQYISQGKSASDELSQF